MYQIYAKFTIKDRRAGEALAILDELIAETRKEPGNIRYQLFRSVDNLWAAAISGAISGGLGAIAGPLGGTIARGFGAVSNGAGAIAASAGLSAAGSAAGQAAVNLIDPCHAISPLNAALWGGLGGGLSKWKFPTNNMKTWNQATTFGPRTFGGLSGTSNAWLNNTATTTSVGVGAAANFPGLQPC
jgi:hypothetical protein